MNRAFAGALALLAGCASPSLPMLGASRAVVEVEGLRYAVWHLPYRAETTRLSAVGSVTTVQNLLNARAAMETATGCAVRAGTLYGDRVMAEALLDCPGHAPVPMQTTQTWGGPAQAGRP